MCMQHCRFLIAFAYCTDIRQLLAQNQPSVDSDFLVDSARHNICSLTAETLQLEGNLHINMKTLRAYLSLLVVLWLYLDHCESLTDSSLPEIFFPFGSDEGDSIVSVGSYCNGPIRIPYTIFNYTTIYVSTTNVRPGKTS